MLQAVLVVFSPLKDRKIKKKERVELMQNKVKENKYKRRKDPSPVLQLYNLA